MGIDAALPEPQFEYDERAYVLYITFGLGEPSYAEQVNDSILAEYGLFTDRLTGFRIVLHEGGSNGG